MRGGLADKREGRPRAAFGAAAGGARYFTRLTFSSILKMPFDEPANIRLNVLGRQRRSSVLRRVRVRSAMAVFPGSGRRRKRCQQGVGKRLVYRVPAGARMPDRPARLRRLALALPALAAAGRARGQAAGRDAALIAAAAAGDTPAVRRLLAEGASVRARDASGRTALLAATQGHHVEAARTLMEAGADVNAQDANRDSPLLLAGARGYTEIARLALAHGPDFRVTNRYGGTALIPACHYGHVETVRVLLASPIPVDHVNDLGWTALLEAIILGDGGPAHTEIVRMLLARGAAAGLPDRNGVTPLAHARQRNQQAIVALLVGAGAR